VIFYHDGLTDFPHGAGPSEPGWYYYNSIPESRYVEPSGPFTTFEDAQAAFDRRDK